jgi:hypothetical protein
VGRVALEIAHEVERLELGLGNGDDFAGGRLYVEDEPRGQEVVGRALERPTVLVAGHDLTGGHL